MDSSNFNLNIVSFNVRGLNDQKKRRSIFRWLKQKHIDICLLQETYCTTKVENMWKNEWGGKIFFSNGTNHARGVAVLIKPGFDVDVLDVTNDINGRMLLLELNIQGTPFNVMNIYAPNTESSQFHFYHFIKRTLNTNINPANNILIGGDFNINFDNDLDKKGGNIIRTAMHDTIIKIIQGILSFFQLNDTWRVKNPQIKRFTWRQKTPPIHSRLDYWLISDALFDCVEDMDILPSFKSDHSPIILHLASIKKQGKGKGLWKLNNSFLQEDKYIKGLTENITLWQTECNSVNSRETWEYIKYKIRQFSITYGKQKVTRMTKTELELETKLKHLEEILDQTPNLHNNEDLYKEINETKSKLEEIDNYKTEGLIMRSRCQWYEKGEKSNEYFLRLENRNRIKKTMNKLQRPDGTLTTDPKEILDLQANYYETLYSPGKEKTKEETIDYLSQIDTPQLSEEQKLSCEGELTIEECLSSLKALKNNKTPGNDGLTIEFYKKFWPILGKFCVSSFNESFALGELSVSQKQAVISLLDKGKDRVLLKNWRPISLLNNDYKIVSKSIANRFINFLPQLVHHNQVGYIKNRNIAENIRAIEDLLFQTDNLNIPGILICVDFRKAFDSIDWTFLELTLRKFNFGSSFIKWIQTFYTNISSCIINNGMTSNYFKLGQGVRQGDPLSPYLFILAVEILGNVIRQNDQIKGITLGNTEIKILQYADDTSGILQDIKSAKHFLKTIEEFGKYSGLKLNIEKTEGLWIGANKNKQSEPLGISWSKNPMRILGIFMSYDDKENYKLNFDNKIEKCKNILNLWQTRNLTLLGRIQIIKTFIISQFSYVTSVINIPEHYVNQINRLIFRFVWRNKKDKLKRNIMHTGIDKGGLRVPDFASMVKASRFTWIKRYISPRNHTWKTLFEHALSSSNLDHNILLFCNFDIKQWTNKGLLSTFYQEVLSEWFRFNGAEDANKEQIIWYNKKLLIRKQPIFYREFLAVGIRCLDDLYGETKELKQFAYWRAKGIKNIDFLKWGGLISIVTKSARIYPPEHVLTDDIFNFESLTFLNRPLNTVTQKIVYDHLISLKCGDNVHVPRINKYTNLDNIDWSKQYITALTIPLDTKTREFQFKFVHDILVNNYWLKKWNLADTDLCTFCKIAREDIIHLFWHCEHVQHFWNDFRETYGRVIGANIDLSLVICGNETPFICTLIFLAKRYIYECRYRDKKPDVRVYKQKVNYVHTTEFEIAKRNNTVLKYIEKWEPLLG